MSSSIKDISWFNTYVNAKPPKHQWIDLGAYTKDFLLASQPVRPNFYRISIKYGLENEKTKGFMYFSSPNQPIEWETETPWTGFYIQMTEDLISNHQHLNHTFLTYGLHEPLYLEKEEETIVTELFKGALKEYEKAHFSLNIITAYCNLLFAHIATFYDRQFGEDKEKHNVLVQNFFNLLNTYYNQTKGAITQPSVSYFAQQLNVTPNYLSDLIKFHTGQPVLDHIHTTIIDTAKKQLQTTNATIAEIAYSLGFEYPNYFSRLFRKLTGVSPSEFRK
jgi:AraC-like DNA-binding protein